jgi:hypothetical protein
MVYVFHMKKAETERGRKREEMLQSFRGHLFSQCNVVDFIIRKAKAKQG